MTSWASKTAGIASLRSENCSRNWVCFCSHCLVGYLGSLYGVRGYERSAHVQGHHGQRKREHDLKRVGVGEKEFVRGDAPVDPAPGEGLLPGTRGSLVIDLPVLRHHLHQQLVGRLTRCFPASVLDGIVFVVEDLPVLGDRQGGASELGPAQLAGLPVTGRLLLEIHSGITSVAGV